MRQKGFTLIELLVVIGILTLLLLITLVAVNPARQFAQSNNTRRQSDVSNILSAINQYTVDHKGVLPTGMNATVKIISKANLDLCSSLVPTYIAALPVDPLTNGGAAVSDCTSNYNTNYQVVAGPSTRITVSAPATELGVSTIAVTR